MTIPFDASQVAAAILLREAEPSAGARVCGTHEKKVGGKAALTAGSRESNRALFEDRAQRFTNPTVKLWKLVEKQNPSVSQRDFPGS